MWSERILRSTYLKIVLVVTTGHWDLLVVLSDTVLDELNVSSKVVGHFVNFVFSFVVGNARNIFEDLFLLFGVVADSFVGVLESSYEESDDLLREWLET